MGSKWRNAGFQQFARAHTLAYKLSRGRIGGTIRGAPVLLLDHIGRRSGEWRTSPLIYIRDGDNYVVVGSKAGSHRHPAWFLNLRDMAETTIEVDGKTVPVTVKLATPAQRRRLWPKAVETYPDYANYQQRTERQIPIVILRPIEPDA